MLYDYILATPIRAHAVPFGIAPVHRAISSDLRSTDQAWARRLPPDRQQVTVVVAPHRRSVIPTGDIRLALAPTLALHLSSISNSRS